MSTNADDQLTWFEIWLMIQQHWAEDEYWVEMCNTAWNSNFNESMVEVDPDFATDIADVCEKMLEHINKHPSVLRRVMLARNLARATGAPVEHLVALAERGGRP